MTETPLTHDVTAPREEKSDPQDPEASSPGFIARLFGRMGIGDGREGAREIIEEVLENEAAEAQSFSTEERIMLENLLRFGELRVEDVMVPRADIIAIEKTATVGELLLVFQKAGHSRIPVYEGTLDDPRGMIHIKDLMSWITTRALNGSAKAFAEGSAPEKISLKLESVDLNVPIEDAQIRREALFVPPSMSGLDLLLRMQITHIHLALVVDEYGGTDGLVSIEDLVEEIVGEIEDEHDTNTEPLIVDDVEKGLVADARAPIDELEERLGVPLLSPEKEEDVGTLGGLVFTIAGRVPVRGELVRHSSGIEFEVLDADARRIKKLKIHRGAVSAST